jgi:hypothetical protein
MINLYRNFPITKPQIFIMAKAVHSDVDPKSYQINNKLLDNWDLFKYGSNLLSVIRDVHLKFE